MRASRISTRNAASAVARFRGSVSFSNETEATVRATLDELRKRGDDALLELTEKFDGVRLTATGLRIGEQEMAEGWRAISPEQRRAMKAAARSIREFHGRALPRDWSARNGDGMTVGERFYPIRRAGLYVPGGRVPLVSTVLMTAIPAQVAGVPEIVVCTPPGRDGRVSSALLAAFHVLGIKEAYRAGGAQAIGSLAFGTRTIPAVDLVAGPGNTYVMEAKRQVFGRVGVDLLPGPSEVMVIADTGARADWVAADILSQAEHGTGKEKVYLAVTEADFWKEVRRALKEQASGVPDRVTVERILDERFLSGICADEDAVVAFANAVAPEHLELQVADSAIKRLTRRISTAGAILQGYRTPTVLGDFVAGPSHTLPTDGTGRFSGGLQAMHFLRRSSVVRSSDKANRAVLPVVEAFAAMESLPVHAASLRRRVR